MLTLDEGCEMHVTNAMIGDAVDELESGKVGIAFDWTDVKRIALATSFFEIQGEHEVDVLHSGHTRLHHDNPEDEDEWYEHDDTLNAWLNDATGATPVTVQMNDGMLEVKPCTTNTR